MFSYSRLCVDHWGCSCRYHSWFASAKGRFWCGRNANPWCMQRHDCFFVKERLERGWWKVEGVQGVWSNRSKLFVLVSNLTRTLSADQTRLTDNVTGWRSKNGRVINKILRNFRMQPCQVLTYFGRALSHCHGERVNIEIIMIQTWILIYSYYYSFIQRVFQPFFLNLGR